MIGSYAPSGFLSSKQMRLKILLIATITMILLTSSMGGGDQITLKRLQWQCWKTNLHRPGAHFKRTKARNRRPVDSENVHGVFIGPSMVFYAQTTLLTTFCDRKCFRRTTSNIAWCHSTLISPELMNIDTQAQKDAISYIEFAAMRLTVTSIKWIHYRLLGTTCSSFIAARLERYMITWSEAPFIFVLVGMMETSLSLHSPSILAGRREGDRHTEPEVSTWSSPYPSSVFPPCP